MWRIGCSIVALALAGLTLGAEQGDEPDGFPTPKGASREALEALTAASQPGADQQAAARRVVELLPPPMPVGATLHAALDSGDAQQLADAVRAAREMLAFTPRSEAALPKDFPTYTPVGVIEVKEYPALRRAQAGEFFTLFNHITSNGIAMTTPVRMEFAEADGGRMRQQNMSFYYGAPSIGEAGRQGRVEVKDAPPQRVLAIGVRGDASPAAIAAANEQLTAWIKRHDELEAAGPVVVMGYNSPMVRGDQRFFEVQLPLADKQ